MASPKQESLFVALGVLLLGLGLLAMTLVVELIAAKPANGSVGLSVFGLLGHARMHIPIRSLAVASSALGAGAVFLAGAGIYLIDRERWHVLDRVDSTARNQELKASNSSLEIRNLILEERMKGLKAEIERLEQDRVRLEFHG